MFLLLLGGGGGGAYSLRDLLKIEEYVLPESDYRKKICEKFSTKTKFSLQQMTRAEG